MLLNSISLPQGGELQEALRQGQQASLMRLLRYAQILAHPPLKFPSSAVQSVEEMALAWDDLTAGVTLWLPSAR